MAVGRLEVAQSRGQPRALYCGLGYAQEFSPPTKRADVFSQYQFHFIYTFHLHYIFISGDISRPERLRPSHVVHIPVPVQHLHMNHCITKSGAAEAFRPILDRSAAYQAPASNQAQAPIPISTTCIASPCSRLDFLFQAVPSLVASNIQQNLAFLALWRSIPRFRRRRTNRTRERPQRAKTASHTPPSLK